MEMERELFVCSCGDLQHQVVLSYFDDEPEIYVTTHLCKHGLLRRIWIAIQYIFGKQSVYGAFEECVLGMNDVKRLNKLLSDRIEFFEKVGK